MFGKLLNYFKEVKSELKKVSWPSRKETVNYTIAVILLSLAFALFLGGVDFILTYLLNKFIL